MRRIKRRLALDIDAAKDICIHEDRALEMFGLRVLDYGGISGN